MGNGSEQKDPIPWYSWIVLVIMLGFGFGVFYATYGLVLPEWLRWAVTIAWLVGTAGLGIYDFGINKNPARNRDTILWDPWTYSHGGAGLVFGVWYMPFVYVLLLVIVWEIFEHAVPGFGNREVIANRAVDVGIALFLWLAVVLVASLATGADFPWIAPVMHESAG
jgi:hypothetical protein